MHDLSCQIVQVLKEKIDIPSNRKGPIDNEDLRIDFFYQKASVLMSSLRR